MITADTSTEQEAILRYVARERNRSGPALLQVAFDAARAISPDVPVGQLQRAIVEQIDERLRPFVGDARMMTDAGWISAYGKAEIEARRTLMAGSGDQKEADKLNRQAVESKRLADAAEKSLQAAWNEFLDVPDEASRLKAVFDQIGHERAMLTPAELESGYKHLYLHGLKTGQDTRDAELAALALIVTRDWRLQVLETLETETNAKLSTLKKRNLELSKRLGRPPHDLG